MRAGSVVLAFFTLTSVASAADTLREFTWGQGPRAAGTEVLPPGQGAPHAQLKVDHRDAAPRTVRLLTVERPPITSPRYAVVGSVRYEAVQGTAYLEMWNVFPNGGRFFSRTLGTSGPMGLLTGSSGWRPFILPFLNQESAPPPLVLEVNLVLPGPGTVHLSPVRLIQFGPGEDPLAVQGQWWSERQAGLAGGLLGAALGCAGGLIGWLSSKGKAPRLVLGLARGLLVFGIMLLGAGLMALVSDQPWAVSYPLLLAGLICVTVIGCNWRSLKRRYEEIELRRMRALDAR
jgi:hypothetical protein